MLDTGVDHASDFSAASTQRQAAFAREIEGAFTARQQPERVCLRGLCGPDVRPADVLVWISVAGKRARYGNAQAIIRRGEPVQFQWSEFLACNRAESPLGSVMGGFTNCAMMEECP
jgi:hypothetical protein